MKKRIIFLLTILMVSFVTFIFPNPSFAQYGDYGCYGSGYTGGCRLRIPNNCTNGGLVPNPNGCSSLAGPVCNTTTFPCAAPGSCEVAGGACATATDCCTGYNCISSVCVGAAIIPESPNTCGNGGIMTAIGCIEVLSGNFDSIARFFLRLGMGIGGGIAFVLIVYAGFMVTTSSGNPQKLAAGKELLTAAVMGLLMLVFAAFILRFMGQDILELSKIGF